jgi:hypothetical protein
LGFVNQALQDQKLEAKAQAFEPMHLLSLSLALSHHHCMSSKKREK